MHGFPCQRCRKAGQRAQVQVYDCHYPLRERMSRLAAQDSLAVSDRENLDTRVDVGDVMSQRVLIVFGKLDTLKPQAVCPYSKTLNTDLRTRKRLSYQSGH